MNDKSFSCPVEAGISLIGGKYKAITKSGLDRKIIYAEKLRR